MFQTATQRWKLLSAINFLTTYSAYNKLKCSLFSRIISSYNSLVQSCQNLCSKCAPRTRTQALRRWRHRKREAAFASSWEYVTVQRLKKLKCATVCHFQGRVFNPTNLLNHVAPSIELMMQIWYHLNFIAHLTSYLLLMAIKKENINKQAYMDCETQMA